MLRALARMGLVYEPEFTDEMIDELGCRDSIELHDLVGLGPSHGEAVRVLAGGGIMTLCEALGMDDDNARAVQHALSDREVA